MAEEELQLVQLRDDFYRDGFYKALSIFAILLIAIVLLIAVSLYLQLSKPKPVTFFTGEEFRTVALVPVDKPYLKLPDLIQWISDVLPKLFTLDFINYDSQINAVKQYFDPNNNSWNNYLDILKIYADKKLILDSKAFVTATPTAAPYLEQDGVITGTGIYGWWILMPIKVSYSSVVPGKEISLLMRVLIVRIPTLNNINGVAIEKMIVVQGKGSQGNQGNQGATNE